jgi:hypothetical protein
MSGANTTVTITPQNYSQRLCRVVRYTLDTRHSLDRSVATRQDSQHPFSGDAPLMSRKLRCVLGYILRSGQLITLGIGTMYRAFP